MNPFKLSIQEILKSLKTNEQIGLSDQEVAKRVEKYGPNSLPETPKENLVWIFLRQFQSPLIYLLVIAAALILLAGQPMDAAILSGILFFNAIIGTIQEGRTANILESLRKFITAETLVIRNGKRIVIPSTDLVPGDIMVLQEGNKIAADARLIEVHNLIIEEAVLTGESQGIQKTTASLKADVSIPDQTNMVFSGTYVLQGIGTAVVTATGKDTEVGKIQHAIEQINTETPLKASLDHLSRWIIYFILAICGALLVVGILQGKPAIELMTMLAALFICVIPEGLPVVLTLVLVSGAYRMAKNNVLVKNLPAVEALGRIDVIVVDKTGTLTRNEMVVQQIFTDETLYEVTGKGYFIQGSVLKNGQAISQTSQEKSLHKMGIVSRLLNHSEVNYSEETNQFTVTGDPTEAATLIFAKKIGIKNDDIKSYKRIYEIPFNSDLQYHASYYEHHDTGILYVIGAPEKLIQKSKAITPAMKAALEQFLSDGLRVLAVAEKTFDLKKIPQSETAKKTFFSNALNDLELIGMFAIQDAIRESVHEIVQATRDAGVHIILVTGDHKKTALFVAKQTGIFREGDHILDGPDFRKTTEENLVREIEHVTVFSRILPSEKQR